MNDFPNLLTPEETARLLKINPGTLAVWRATNRYDLPYLKVGSHIRYREEDVLAFVERGGQRGRGRPRKENLEREKKS